MTILMLVVVWGWIIIGSVFMTGAPFIIPVLMAVNGGDESRWNYLWIIPAWIIGACLMVLMPILYFIIAIPLTILSYIFAPNEFAVAVVLSGSVVGILYLIQ